VRRSALIAAAIVVDALIGDPDDWPHPVRAIGALVDVGEKLLRSRVAAEPKAERIAGAALALGVAAAASAAGAIARCSALCEVPLAASALALRNLIDESERVVASLDLGDIASARSNLARIVGRDTDALNESEIARATIETLAESLCDGVIAPLFYLTLGGTSGALAYKAINTLDSMIGHIEPPYRDVGWFAARLDDVANWIPARIASVCIVGAATIANGRGDRAWETLRHDGDASLSPNAGQTEAAMAGALGVRLGGANLYDGVPVSGAIFNEGSPAPRASDVRDAQKITVLAACIAYAAALVGAWCFDER
jgi:adenosylcobinamide-phosphate synthase